RREDKRSDDLHKADCSLRTFVRPRSPGNSAGGDCDRESSLDRALEDSSSYEHLTNLRKRAGEGIDLLVRVVEGQRGTGGGRDAEPVHQRLTAVMPRTNRNTLTIHDRADIVGMSAIHDKRQYSCLLLSRSREPQTGNGVQRARTVRQKIAFVGRDS